MNEYMIQTKNSCKEQTAILERIIETYDDGMGFCCVEMKSQESKFQFNVDLYGFADKTFKEKESMQFKLAFYYSRNGEMFDDEKVYEEIQSREAQERFEQKGGVKWRLDSQCLISLGSIRENADGTETNEDNTVLLIGKILSVEKAVYDNVKSLHIVVACRGLEFDVFLDDDDSICLKEGNILKAVYYVIGYMNY